MMRALYAINTKKPDDEDDEDDDLKRERECVMIKMSL
jgi:hypothetical protein